MGSPAHVSVTTTDDYQSLDDGAAVVGIAGFSAVTGWAAVDRSVLIDFSAVTASALRGCTRAPGAPNATVRLM